MTTARPTISTHLLSYLLTVVLLWLPVISGAQSMLLMPALDAEQINLAQDVCPHHQAAATSNPPTVAAISCTDCTSDVQLCDCCEQATPNSLSGVAALKFGVSEPLGQQLPLLAESLPATQGTQLLRPPKS